MANREENLKKINAELEKLSDDELENVAGGTVEEISEDVNRFKKLNISIFGEGLECTPAHDVFYASLIMEFRKHGVKYVHSYLNKNQYYIDGKQVTQDEAWKHIEAH